ncbi:hypothetical protein [Serratia phage vB_SmaM_Hera]|uniref:Uncharacterized protein n=1 Tax=Serratia phage vB_SmaM_Hera TaxID=2777369 RepID=A0A7T3N9B9_9CAUD|nr:hypothetical protein [Serratia phage vB_SmaM_Hera]
MKKIFTAIFTTLFSYALMAALIYALVMKDQGVANVVIAVYWLLIVVAPIAVTGAFVAVLSYSKLPIAERYEAIVDGLQTYRKRNLVYRIWSIIWSATVIIILAYFGAIFTATCLFISTVVTRLIVAVTRDQLLAYEKAIIGYNAVRKNAMTSTNFDKSGRPTVK